MIYIELNPVGGFVDNRELKSFVAAVEAASEFSGSAKVELMLNGLRCEIKVGE